MVIVQCIGEGGAEEEEGGAEEEGDAGSSPAASSIGTSSSFGCPLVSQPAAMAAISFFLSDVSPSERALSVEDIMVGVMRRGIGGK
jgi:hypothetical protein